MSLADDGSQPPPQTPSPQPLRDLALLFLKLGTVAFGGPAAHIAMMEEEVVRRRQWLSPQEFLDLLSASNLIPGPNSTELAIHIGRLRAGWRGLLVAGLCFILPASAIVTAVAWAYVRYGALPEVGGLLYGIKPVVMAIVVHAVWRLARSALRTQRLAWLAAAALVAAALGVHELVVLGGAALIMLLGSVSEGTVALPVTWLASQKSPWVTSLGAATGGAVAGSLWPMFWTFFKIGATLFGSGYVLIAYLRADFVERLGWLTERQLLDAIAVGQITPGPVFTTATFVGYLFAGGAGAVTATVGIFLPAFVLVAVTAPYLGRLRSSPTVARILDGVNVASLALMALVALQLSRAALVDGITTGLAAASAVLLWHYRVNSTWLLLAGGLIGLVLVR